MKGFRVERDKIIVLYPGNLVQFKLDLKNEKSINNNKKQE